MESFFQKLTFTIKFYGGEVEAAGVEAISVVDGGWWSGWLDAVDFGCLVTYLKKLSLINSQLQTLSRAIALTKSLGVRLAFNSTGSNSFFDKR